MNADVKRFYAVFHHLAYDSAIVVGENIKSRFILNKKIGPQFRGSAIQGTFYTFPSFV